MVTATEQPAESAVEETLDQSLQQAWEIAAAVPDPELPMLTIGDLGILREISVEDGRLTVSLTPTYSGCPALAEMGQLVFQRLTAAGFAAVEVRTLLSPPWSSAMITADGRRKLAETGIAPPRFSPQETAGPVPLTLFARGPVIECPVCGSADTWRTAAFAGTACRDLYRCGACAEPFEHVKEI
jgi:ring-1,2-phenylacetyl-CoA epoxidase subunit PaaD